MIPEEIPLIVTISNAISISFLMKKNCEVRNVSDTFEKMVEVTHLLCDYSSLITGQSTVTACMAASKIYFSPGPDA